ncbi:SH3 domain-containing protein [Streptomyces sp. NPDC054840]
MLKPTRTILTLAAGSLVLGLVGAGAAVADVASTSSTASQRTAAAADGRHAIGRVVSKGPLKVRSKPTTRSQVVGQLQPNRRVEIECKEYGQSVDGNRIWYRLHEGNGNQDGRDSQNSNQDGRDSQNDDQDGRDSQNDDQDGRDWQNGNQDGGMGGRRDDDQDGRDWQNGNQDGGMGGRRDDDRAYGQEHWVAARYVENLTPVRYCR